MRYATAQQPKGATNETICTNQLVLCLVLRSLGGGGSLGEGGRSA